MAPLLLSPDRLPSAAWPATTPRHSDKQLEGSTRNVYEKGSGIAFPFCQLKEIGFCKLYLKTKKVRLKQHCLIKVCLTRKTKQKRRKSDEN